MKRWLIVLLCFSSAPLFAEDLSLYYLPNFHLQYEGLGYRPMLEGWDIKSKPSGVGSGFRWVHPFRENLSMEAQYWRNESFFDREDGNATSKTLRQTGQTKIGLQALTVGLRRPLAGSSVDLAAGLQGVYQSFRRKDIIYYAVPEPARAREILSAMGGYVGFRGFLASAGEKSLYLDWEAVMGHFFFTDNRLTIEGGSIHRDGYSYGLRLEAGWRSRHWRVGAGFVRQMFQVMVPGGKTLPGGATVSFPINKTDFASPLLAVAYEF